MRAGTVASIHVARLPGAPMTAITTAHVVPGKGIEGDRFYALRSEYAAIAADTCDVTLVEQEALDALKRENTQLSPDDVARRNIVTRGCSLQRFVGRTFRIGGVTLHGLAPHESCDSDSVQQAASCMAVYGTDLRAQVLTEGMIVVGDPIQALEE